MIDMTALARMLEPLRRRVSLIVRRALINLVDDDNPVQVVQLKLFKNECRDGVERLQEYGLSSVPLKGGQALVVSVDGECAHGVIVATDDRRYRPTKLEPGDVMLYTFANKKGEADTEHHIVLRAKTRGVEVRGKTITLDADENIELKAGGKIIATAKGDVDVNGANIHLNGG